MYALANEFDWAWAAGIVDGEGCICITHSKGKHFATLSIEMTHAETIRKLHRIFKCGCLSDRAREENHKHEYKIMLHGQEAIDAVKKLAPYLVTKREQAILLLEYGEKCQMPEGWNKPVPVDVEALREIIYEELQELNKRGTDRKATGVQLPDDASHRAGA